MNDLILSPLTAEEKETFTKEIQNAFQEAYEEEFGKFDKPILPREDIEESFNEKGSHAYAAKVGEKTVGGAIAVTDDESGFSSLHLLYVKPEFQNCGYGFRIWDALEKTFPKTKVWETHTPYYDKRNIHFYVNRCGFKIVEFFNPKHKDPHQKGETSGNIPTENNYFFRFEKTL